MNRTLNYKDLNNIASLKTLYENALNEGYSLKEKKVFYNFLKKTGIDLWDILIYFYCNKNLFSKFFYNLNFVEIINNTDFIDSIIEISKKYNLNENDFQFIYQEINKMTVIILTSNNILEEKSLSKEINLYFRDLSLIEKRFPSINKPPKKNNDKIHAKFRFTPNYVNKSNIIWKKLKDENKISTNTSLEDFNAAFSINKSKNKIIWKSSIFQLKMFIKKLRDEKIIFNEPNYIDVIINCFEKEKKILTPYNLNNSSGEKHTLDFIDRIINSI